MELAYGQMEALLSSVPTTVVAILIYNWLVGRKSATSKKALARHYAVFGQ